MTEIKLGRANRARDPLASGPVYSPSSTSRSLSSQGSQSRCRRHMTRRSCWTAVPECRRAPAQADKQPQNRTHAGTQDTMDNRRSIIELSTNLITMT